METDDGCVMGHGRVVINHRVNMPMHVWNQALVSRVFSISIITMIHCSIFERGLIGFPLRGEIVVLSLSSAANARRIRN